MTWIDLQGLWFLGVPLGLMLLAVVICDVLSFIGKHIKRFDYESVNITGVMIGMVVFGVIWMFGLIDLDKHRPVPIKIEQIISDIEITALSDNTTTSGSVYGSGGHFRRFYIRGVINETWQYSIYQKINDSYSLVSIPADMTTIYETNDTPHYIKYCKVAQEYNAKWFIFKIQEDGYMTDECRYTLNIPYGTINNSYELDLE